jgi:hypothetical protein
VLNVSARGESLRIWPYTTNDLETPSGPVNLLFPNTDPRAIRQALLGASTDRTGSPFAGLPFSDCGWSDGMASLRASSRGDGCRMMPLRKERGTWTWSAGA